MDTKQTIISYRIIFALLGLSAIVTEIAVLIERGRLVPANFFSFFTVESNIIAAIALAFSALTLIRGKKSRFVAMLRGASTLNMIIVGVIFSVLLSGLDAELTAVPWDNIVLHYILPIVVALDWLFDIPTVRISFRQALVWLIFPVVYVIYSLLRGSITNWYPYPFLNPAIHGYGGVAVICVVLMACATALAYVLSWSSLRKKREKEMQ